MTHGRGRGRSRHKVPLSPENPTNHTETHKQIDEEEQLEDDEPLDFTEEKVLIQKEDEKRESTK